MDSPTRLKKDWVLTKEAFDRLLVMLDADREQAGQRYENVRLKLVKYFQWRGAVAPDREADETLNRVARRIEEGARVENLNAYLYGVAKLVFAESLKARERERDSFNQASLAQGAAATEDSDLAERRACLDRCLQALPKESYRLILGYYEEEKGRKIERRKHLAAQLNIPLNALRIRAHRIRVGLEACVRECVGQNA